MTHLIEGNAALNLLSFSTLSFLLLYSIFRSLYDIEQFEKRRLEQIYQKGIIVKIKDSIVQFFVVGFCAAVAGYNANFQLIWKIYAMMMFLFGIHQIVISCKYTSWKHLAPKIPKIDQKIIKKNVQRRKRWSVFHVALFTLWVFTWHNKIW